MTRQLVLIVPGLLWPAPQTRHPAQDVPLAALSRLLGRGRRRIDPAAPPEHLLTRLFGIDDDAPPLAALRRLGEDKGDAAISPSRPGTHWLCADPVNLALTRDYLLAGDFVDGEIEAAEANALCAALNQDIPGLGQFSAVTPTRWYLRIDRPPAARFALLHEIIGRPIQDFLPEGDEADARFWRHTLNEIQILLHNHPVNRAREAAGRRTINSLWFWGASAHAAPDAAPNAPCPAIQTLDPVARGLARAAGIEPGSPDVGAALDDSTLVTLDALATPARRLDLDAWRAALAALEDDWFAPIATAFDAGTLHRLELHVPGDRFGFSLVLGARSRWCFWRKPLPLDDLHALNASYRSAAQIQ
ncbi:MAG: hypothetical protein LBP58_02590 [Azoarcus sp.]|jgi:hypothetical protein|nr:hypothetical protein [Azoarcus sp.]